MFYASDRNTTFPLSIPLVSKPQTIQANFVCAFAEVSFVARYASCRVVVTVVMTAAFKTRSSPLRGTVLEVWRYFDLIKVTWHKSLENDRFDHNIVTRGSLQTETKQIHTV